ncbi:MAG: methionine ABC transporter ATP-binding protein [Burkholderiaceae bacterium]|jgi:D-methionine transport system ATP-binding protein|nr:methionine ABC transporter ATP-binding protein [Burkholderiaceae bacterium]
MIDIRALNLSYPGPAGPVQALRNIHLHVQAGEVFGIIGRSGAGKSSLVRAINLLNRPSSGHVVVGGREMTALDGAQLRAARREIGMIFQHFNLLSSRTVFDNVALPLELACMDKAAIRARVEPLLDLVGLTRLRDRYPAQISGGQKQRVGIARALASSPKVLLSDEATSALDPETTRAVLALLKKINQELNLTIVLITHQMQVIKQVADRVAVLDAGEVVETGQVLDVFTQPQHAITRSLIDEIAPQDLPASVLAHIRGMQAEVARKGLRGQLWRLVFAGESTYSSAVADVIKLFNVDVSIVHGQVDEIQGVPFGLLAVFVAGTQEQLEAGKTHLHNLGVKAREVSHV